MQTTSLQYGFLEYFYYGNKKNYEKILCECLNASPAMKKIGGGTFSLVEQQHDKQDDVTALNYSLDFKLMISQSLAQFQSIITPKANIDKHGISHLVPGKSCKQKAVFLLNMCRNINETLLTEYRIKAQGSDHNHKDKPYKEIVYFFDKTLNTPKNLLLFFPAYIETVDFSLTKAQQFSSIHNELSHTLKYLFEFRKAQQPNYDTYFVYIVSVHNCCNFFMVINQFSDSELILLDYVDYFSLSTVRNIGKQYL